MRTILIYSGGLDSTTLLYCLRQAGQQVSALSVHYGQRHVEELRYAEVLCRRLAVPWMCLDLQTITPLLQGSSQTDASIPVPEGHYTAASMALTIVPNRNMVLLSIAAAWAVSQGADAVAYAAHAGDHAIYPDCRAAFVEAMRAALGVCHVPGLQLLTPFLTWSKGQIVAKAIALGVNLAETWSCYAPIAQQDGSFIHCGRCGTDVERILACQEAGVLDPTIYADPDYWQTVQAPALP
jgi:7-cyano-7-deazaguanine synthase